MVRLFLQQLVSLTLAALLLVQYAPLGELVHVAADETCQHCRDGYCLRYARGETCDHHHDGKHPKGHADHHAADGGGMAKGGDSLGFRTCSPPQTLTSFVLALDQVTLSRMPEPVPVAQDDLLFLPAAMLRAEPFAAELFHPPPRSL